MEKIENESVKETENEPTDPIVKESKTVKNVLHLKGSGLMTCEKCDYSCKEKNTLDNHMKSNHEAKQCNQCKKRFSSFSDVLEHDQKEHQSGEVQNDTSFVFSESMLDEFDK